MDPLPENPQNHTRDLAGFLLDPASQAFAAVAACRPPERSGVHPAELIAELKAIAATVSSGDGKHSETVAATQATALNVIFARLTEMAMGSVDSPYFESLMRLAFRAQAQSVRALETVANLRKPAAIVARQLNVAHQQIVSHGPATLPTPAPAPPLPPPCLDTPIPALTTTDSNSFRLAENSAPLTESALQTASDHVAESPNSFRLAEIDPLGPTDEPRTVNREPRTDAQPLSIAAA